MSQPILQKDTARNGEKTTVLGHFSTCAFRAFLVPLQKGVCLCLYYNNV